MTDPAVGQQPDGPVPSFEERLKAAREKRGLEPASKDEGGGMGWAERPLAMAFRLAGELVAAMAVAVAIGWWLDRVLGTAPWLLVLFVVLGSAAGILNVWRLFAPDGGGPPRSRGSGGTPEV
ncbi:MAG: AtpZ/AtpI family protein [Rhodospirillales bacterium]|nr:AtpZ/AtpI family protein [Rhodospirillales bacterium]